MDPISALGLAANIAQFVDMGIAIVRNTKEIAGVGATISTLHLASLASDIKNISSSLTLKCRESPLDTLSQEEKDLCELAIRCTKTANELKECLDQITVCSDKKKSWRSVLAAVKTAWTAERIDTITKQLLDHRNQLSLRVLLVLNQRHRGQQDVMSALRDEIVEVIAVTYQDLKAAIGNQQSETATAILTTRDGGTTAITNPGAESRFSPRLASGKATETSVTYSSQIDRAKGIESNESEGAPEKKQYIPMTVHDVGDYRTKILNSLHFRGITERFSAIPSAHKDTFEWIWQEPVSDLDVGKWDSLSKWLQASTASTRGCYWLSGKAGSGKSSLMKYLQNDQRTLDHLKEWAGSAELVVPSFYFWYAGTSLQKSYTGLLQSLLFEILSRRPEIIAAVFPDLCRAAITKSLVGRINPTYVELKAAFSKLVQHLPVDLRICFFIDGIDEYTGDHNDICDFFCEVTKHPSIKALLSSRPIPACAQQFEGYPKLRLQDLTQKDIKLYLQDHLGTHSLMARMNEGEPGIMVSLINKIIDLASGVFLWVHLVVRNIYLRLQDYDTAADLMDEVDKLPSDLEKLYDYMLGGMSEQNRVYGSKVLQVMLRDFELDIQYPMTVLQLSFTEDEDYEKCLGTPMEALEERAYNWRCEATEGRLRSRCCGLIEVSVATNPLDPRVAGDRIGFFHRTVVEFLETDMVWEKLCLLTAKTSFDAEMALMSSSISELKAMPIRNCDYSANECALLRMARMLSYEKDLSPSGKKAFHDIYMPKMRDVLGHHWHNKDLFESADEEVRAVNFSCIKGCERMKLEFPYSSILSLSLQFASQQVMSVIQQSLRLKVDFGEKSVAYLAIHFAEEKRAQLREALSKNIELLHVSLDKSISLPKPIKRLWNDRWKSAIKGNACDWKLQEFILHHCFSIMDNTEDGGFDFTNEIMVQSLLRVLLKLVVSDFTSNAIITIAVRPRGNMRKKTFSFDEPSVVRLLLQKIWSTLSKVPNTGFSKTAQMLCTLELRLDVKLEGVSHGNFENHTDNLTLGHYLTRGFRLMWSTRRISRDSENIKRPIYSGMVAELSSTKGYIPKLISEAELPQAGVESPWFRYEPPHMVTQPPWASFGSQDGGYGLPGKTEWDLTSPSRRYKLLREDEQNLVGDLLMNSQNAMRKIRVFEMLSEMPFDRQSKILECFRAIESKGTDFGNAMKGARIKGYFK